MPHVTACFLKDVFIREKLTSKPTSYTIWKTLPWPCGFCGEMDCAVFPVSAVSSSGSRWDFTVFPWLWMCLTGWRGVPFGFPCLHYLKLINLLERGPDLWRLCTHLMSRKMQIRTSLWCLRLLCPSVRTLPTRLSGPNQGFPLGTCFHEEVPAKSFVLAGYGWAAVLYALTTLTCV